MADVVTTQILNDGPRNAVIKFTNVSDGTGESAVTKVDVSALSKNGRGETPTSVRIDKVNSMTSGMGISVFWDATANVLALTIPNEESYENDFRGFGGIQNNSGAGKTGDIIFTTTSPTAGDTYTVVLTLVKGYA